MKSYYKKKYLTNAHTPESQHGDLRYQNGIYQTKLSINNAVIKWLFYIAFMISYCFIGFLNGVTHIL